MPRTVKCGLIQASNAAPTDAPIEEIKRANIDKHLKMIEDAARQGVQIYACRGLTTPLLRRAARAMVEAVEKIKEGRTRSDAGGGQAVRNVIVVPIYEEEITGVFYNTAAVMMRMGDLGKYQDHPARPARLRGKSPSSRQSGFSGLRHGLARIGVLSLRPPLSEGARTRLEWSRDRL